MPDKGKKPIRAVRDTSLKDDVKEAISSMLTLASADKIRGKIRDAEYDRSVSEMTEGEHMTVTKRRDNEVR